MSRGISSITPIARVKPDENVDRVKLRCDKHPDAIAPNIKNAAQALVALTCGDWQRMREIAFIYNDPQAKPDQQSIEAEIDPQYRDCIDRIAKYTEALRHLGFTLEPKDEWTCDIAFGGTKCKELVNHNGRHSWETGSKG